jgi:hypothetical protein
VNSEWGDMQTFSLLALLCCVWGTACTGSEAPSASSTPSAAEWFKIGETETYDYYADRYPKVG